MYKDHKSSTITEWILDGKNNGILICILADEQRGYTHVVGMNLKLGLIYDCMEQYSFVLNKDNLACCCGDDKIFQSSMFNAKLKPKV